jgi:hypothetical protein
LCLVSVAPDERINIDGVDRGTVSSSLVTVGGEIRFFQIVGDPRGSEYETFRRFFR